MTCEDVDEDDFAVTVKPGASIALLTPDMKAALEIVEGCYAVFGADCIVTSGDERTTLHQGKPVAGGVEDPHYEGKALDFRIWNVAEASREILVARIRRELGDAYVVLWEARDQPNEHLHVQAGRVLA